MKKFILVAFLAACGDTGIAPQLEDAGTSQAVDAGTIIADAGTPCTPKSCHSKRCEIDTDECGHLCNCDTGCTRSDCKTNSNPKQCCVVQRFVCKLDTCVSE